MKILYVATAYPRSETDVITPWLVETVRRLRAAGDDVRVFTSSYRGLGNQTIGGVPVYRFRYCLKQLEDLTHDETAIDRIKKGIHYKLLAVLYLFFGTFAAWRVARRERFDVIHVHWPLPHALFGWAAAAGSRAPVVVSFYGAELRAARHGFRLLRPFLRRAIKSAAAVTAISRHTADDVKELCDRELEIVPYGTTAGEGRKSEPPPQNRIRQLLFVGRLVERKGVAFLLRATGLLKCDIPVHLNIVGTGSEEPALHRLVKELDLEREVTFHGFVSAGTLAALYRNCDVFVLPAVVDAKGDTEGLGVVLIEAMSYRRPVVASNLGGIVDIVIHEQNGLLVPPQGPEALAAAVHRIIADPEFARRLGEAGFRHVRDNYSWSAIIARLQSIYRRVAGRPGAR